jgi:UPF0271 protein
LAPRSQPGAVIEEPGEVLAQARRIAAGLGPETPDGVPLGLRVDTLCLHGEGPRAAELAALLSRALSGG